jgi:hypothetical protein
MRTTVRAIPAAAYFRTPSRPVHSVAPRHPAARAAALTTPRSVYIIIINQLFCARTRSTAVGRLPALPTMQATPALRTGQ